MAKSSYEKNRTSNAYKVFSVFNYILLIILALSCVLPIIHVLAMSFSSRQFADAGVVGIIPKGWTIEAYKYVFKSQMFFTTLGNSLFRVIFGVSICLIMNMLIAYPMSKSKREFRGRNAFLVLIVITMFFSGGLVPSYLLIKKLGLYDTLWVYVIPGINTYFALLMMNFFRSMPKEIEEAAKVDGCDYFRLMILIVIPLSKPVLATILLYAFVGHWNSWFDGYLYSATQNNYPLQTYLYKMLNAAMNSTSSMTDAEAFKALGGNTVASAQICITTLPILVVYPFVQKYFVQGIVLGSVKG